MQTRSQTKTTLVLGHGKYYVTHGMRCSPIPLDDWINDSYTSVDCDPDVEPDIVFNLRIDKWTFAKDSEYDRIIDTTGIGLFTLEYKKDSFWKEIDRILKPGGTFYGIRGHTITKKPLSIAIPEDPGTCIIN
jgi:hypothetical protein